MPGHVASEIDYSSLIQVDFYFQFQILIILIYEENNMQHGSVYWFAHAHRRQNKQVKWRNHWGSHWLYKSVLFISEKVCMVAFDLLIQKMKDFWTFLLLFKGKDPNNIKSDWLRSSNRSTVQTRMSSRRPSSISVRGQRGETRPNVLVAYSGRNFW